MASRIIVRVDLTPAAQKAVDKLTEKHGMTQLSMLSRIVEWLADQPAAVQTAVLGQWTPESSHAAAMLMLERTASGK